MTLDKTLKINILGFGDSLTAGFPGYDPSYRMGNEKSQYSYWLIDSANQEGWQNIEFDNKGVPGELAQYMFSRLVTLLGKKSYDLIIILGGTNDIGWNIDPLQIFENLRRLWMTAKESGANVIACTVPPIGSVYLPVQKVQEELNQKILKEISPNDKIFRIDLFNALVNEEGLLKPEYDAGDGVHLSIEGYKRMGEFIWTEGIHPLLKREFQEK
ncbi:GDSL-type esterase/lipase family protein [Candidatus Borrarchaeum sp.]|uniref:SGNH/GDSL hydrolase family protein n=1 Tax=Candidatus Borrarchaeum sp. TaxID=2846742 RepID=UPI00257AA014|nr:GDSL-type esterase/lipase family protein [Candidatus Borrarchaeum sp.]